MRHRVALLSICHLPIFCSDNSLQNVQWHLRSGENVPISEHLMKKSNRVRSDVLPSLVSSPETAPLLLSVAHPSSFVQDPRLPECDWFISITFDPDERTAGSIGSSPCCPRTWVYLPTESNPGRHHFLYDYTDHDNRPPASYPTAF